MTTGNRAKDMANLTQGIEKQLGAYILEDRLLILGSILHKIKALQEDRSQEYQEALGKLDAEEDTE